LQIVEQEYLRPKVSDTNRLYHIERIANPLEQGFSHSMGKACPILWEKRFPSVGKTLAPRCFLAFVAHARQEKYPGGTGGQDIFGHV